MRVVTDCSVHFSQSGHQGPAIVERISIDGNGLDFAGQLRLYLVVQRLANYEVINGKLRAYNAHEDDQAHDERGASVLFLMCKSTPDH